MKLTSFLKTLVISILACTNILGQTFIIPRPVKYHTLKVRDIVQDPKISSLIPAVYSIYDSIKNDDEEIKPDDYLKIGDSSYSARNKAFDVEGNIIPITVPDNQLKVSIYSSGDLKGCYFIQIRWRRHRIPWLTFRKSNGGKIRLPVKRRN